MQNIRLSDFYIKSIKTAFGDHFGKDDHLWIFGSRVEMDKRGGDIDLYIKTNQKDVQLAKMAKDSFLIELWKILDMQKIDIVLNCAPFEDRLPIYEVAEKEGVLLV